MCIFSRDCASPPGREEIISYWPQLDPPLLAAVQHYARHSRHPDLPKLWLVALTIFESLSSVFSCFLVIGAVIFIVAVFLVQGVAAHLCCQNMTGADSAQQLQLREVLLELYGGIPASAICLFMMVSGGIDWRDAMIPMKKVHGSYEYFLTFYVFFMVIIVLNVVIKALNQNQTSYDADCVRRARRNMLKCPALYSVATGSFKSPLYWQRAAPGRYDHTCPFCGKQEEVSHEHIFWQCPRNGGIQPPADPQRRLGWPCTGNKAYDGKVWNHMAQTVLSVWESRFPRSSPTWLRGNYCQ